MSDLTGKFTTLEEQLTSQNGALLTALAAQQTSLDAINTAMSGLSTTIASLAADASAIREAISVTGEAAPLDAKSSILWSAYRLADAVAPSWPRPTSVPVQPAIELLRAALDTVLGINTLGPDYTLQQLLVNIKENIGIPTGDATTTVLGRLQAIQRTTLTCCNSNDPSIASPGACTTPVSSISPNQGLSAYPGRVFAVWPDLSSYGINNTDTYSLTIPNIEEYRSDWTGISLFVGSNGSHTFYLTPGGTSSFPTNQWIDLGGLGLTYAIAVNVPEGADMKAYICTDNIVTSGCVRADSVSTEATPSYGLSPRQMATPAGYTVTDHVFGTSYNRNAVLDGDYNGYTIRLLSGPLCRVVLFTPGGPVTEVLTTANPGPYTIPGTTQQVVMDDLDTVNQALTGPFAIEFCAPIA